MKLFKKVFTSILLTIGSLCQTEGPCHAQIPLFEWARQAYESEGFDVSSSLETHTIVGTTWDSAVFIEPDGNQIFDSSYIRGLCIHNRSDLGAFNWFGAVDVFVSWNIGEELCATMDGQFVYFAGMVGTYPDWDIDPGPDSTVMSLTKDALIIKFSSQGEIIWAKSIGDSISTRQAPRDLVVDSEGNVYTCGWFKGSPDFDPGPDTLLLQADNGNGSGFIHKMNSEGELLWAGMIGYTGAANGLAIDSLDNVYVVGYFQDTVDIAPGPDTLMIGGVTGNIEAYVLKLNPDGLTEWAAGIGGSGGEFANSVALGPNGNILVSGTFNDTVNSYPLLIDEPLLSAGDNDIFIWELDPDGNSLNAYRIGGPETDGTLGSGVNQTTEISTDLQGNVYLYGNINHGHPELTVDMDSGPDTAWSQDFGIEYYFIAKYDPDMNLIWAMPGNGAADFAVGGGQELYITGSFTDTIDLDPGPVQQLYISEGGSDMYVVKLNQDSLLTTNGKVESVKSESGLAVSVYPNPSVGSFTVVLSSEISDVRYEISDLAGRGVQTESVQSSKFTVELESEPGVYLLRIWSDDEWTVVRLVKE